MSKIWVEGLYTYPIKSCAGTRMLTADINERGLVDDRTFMVTDIDGVFISQRTHPELALVRPEVTVSDADLLNMSVTAPGMETLRLSHEPSARHPVNFIETIIHGKAIGALRTTDEADAWFSEYLNMPTYLCASDPQSHRLINDRYWHHDSTNETAFADAFPMLLASRASLDAFNQSMAEQTGAEPIPMDRFRPNIVVRGEDLEAYDEDYWRRIQIGRMIAYVVRPCKRCAIPYVDQETGNPTGNKTVGKTLATMRRGKDTTKPDDNGKGVFFAQNLVHVYEEGLWLDEGDIVQIHDRSDSPNVDLR